MSELTLNIPEQAKEYKKMCHCEADLTIETLTHEYQLPLVNRQLLWPAKYYWENVTMAYLEVMNSGAYNNGLTGAGDEQLPALNHLATSYNTEDQHSNAG